MNILISNANDKPIYEQIYTQIRNQILSGALPPGQALPSIRALAKGHPGERDHHQTGPMRSWKKRGTSTPSPPRAPMWRKKTPSWSGKPI